MTEQVKTMLQGMPQGNPNDFVFTNHKGLKVTHLSNSFARAVKPMGLNKGISDPRRKLTFHGLRHTDASWLVESGVSIYVVREMLGHASIAMSEMYSHVRQNSMRDAVKTLEQSLKQQPGNVVGF